ncbi:hypothetical protein K8R30_01320 [archaeon]|nr:hypothetical protein [archaeon]
MQERDLFGILYIISKFDKIHFRKRLQKIVCISKMDQEIGYPFTFNFRRYLYGPYSFDFKESLDELIKLNIIKEELGEEGQYSYFLTATGKARLTILKRRYLLEKGILTKFFKKYPKSTSVKDLVVSSKKVFGW